MGFTKNIKIIPCLSSGRAEAVERKPNPVVGLARQVFKCNFPKVFLLAFLAFQTFY